MLFFLKKKREYISSGNVIHEKLKDNSIKKNTVRSGKWLGMIGVTVEGRVPLYMYVYV